VRRNGLMKAYPKHNRSLRVAVQGPDCGPPLIHSFIQDYLESDKKEDDDDNDKFSCNCAMSVSCELRYRTEHISSSCILLLRWIELMQLFVGILKTI
jgi:hypothetical protein